MDFKMGPLISFYGIPQNYFFIESNLLVFPHPTKNQWISYLKNQTKLSYLEISSSADLKSLEDNVINYTIQLANENEEMIENQLKGFIAIQAILKNYDLVAVKSTMFADFNKSIINGFFMNEKAFHDQKCPNLCGQDIL